MKRSEIEDLAFTERTRNFCIGVPFEGATQEQRDRMALELRWLVDAVEDRIIINRAAKAVAERPVKL